MGSSFGPLAGVRVLELGNFIAAPSAGRLLADFGAEVIKVERPVSGDELRRWRLHRGDTSLLFQAVNRGKKSVTLDLKTERGRRLALELARGCDVLLENFRPGTLERWGMGPDELRAANPGLVVVRISGYGQSGPYRDRPGFGGVAEAFSGLRNLTGYPGLPPTRVGISLADSLAGLYAVIGALMALHARGAANAGEVVDVALYEGVYSLMESLVPDYEAFGIEPQRTGSALAGVAPSNTYLCRDDRYVVVSGNGDAIFHRLMLLIGRPDLAGDPDLADNAGRVARAAELDAAIGTWTGGLAHDEALAALERESIPAGPIYTASDIVDDAHYAARGMHVRQKARIGAGDYAEVSFPGAVPALQNNPGNPQRRSPLLGEHTGEVLAGLGIGADGQRELAAAGVI